MTMRMHRCAGLPPRRRTALHQAARLHSHEARLRRTAARPPSPAVLLHRAGVHPRHAVHLRSRAVLRRRPVRIHPARQSADLPEPRLLHSPARDLLAVRSARAAPLHRSVRAVLLLRFARMVLRHRLARAEPAPKFVRTAVLPRLARAAHRLPYADLPAVLPHPAAALLSVRTATAEQCARTILLPPTGKPLLRV